MCKYFFLMVMLLFPCEGFAQSFINADLQHFLRSTLTQELEYLGDDVVSAGIVVMKVDDGKVLGDICLEINDGIVVEKADGNKQPIPAGIGRAVNFLAVVDRIGAGFICNTGNGIYHDNHTGEVVEDDNARWGGNGLLSLDRILDVSDVGTIIALNEAFNRDFISYRKSLLMTGVLGAYEDCEDSIAVPSGYWPIEQILGVTSKFSLIQQTAWINMLANNGRLVVRLDENDSSRARVDVKSKNAVKKLSRAMLEAVENGSCRRMKPNNIDLQVAGISNVSHADANGVRSCFGGAFFPYSHPLYTIAVFVNKRELPAGRIIPANIISRVIQHMGREILKIHEEPTPKNLHPAAR